MANAKIWKNVGMAMQSALAAAKTITAITKANPGVASSTAHGYANGEWVYLSVTGMQQVSGMVVRVAGVTTDTFQLEGVDTTLFDTFSAGTAEKITFGTTISTATSITVSGGTFATIPTTTIHGSRNTSVPGLPEESTMTMDNIHDISDAGLLAMRAAYLAQAKRAFKIQWGTGGQIMVFSGSVGASLMPGGTAQGLVTTPSIITLDGEPNYYAS